MMPDTRTDTTAEGPRATTMAIALHGAEVQSEVTLYHRDRPRVAGMRFVYLLEHPIGIPGMQLVAYQTTHQDSGVIERR